MLYIYRPLFDIGTNVRETYTLDMAEYRRNNPTDVFFCNLLEIDPYHYQHLQESLRNETHNVSDESVVRKFADPRTGIEIPSHECNHRNVNLESRNIFLNNYIQASSLPKAEHIAGLSAIRGVESASLEQITDEPNDHIPNESGAANRLQEKQLFLDKLQEHYFSKLSQRYHDVPPSIDYFITQKWKRQLIDVHRRLTHVHYCMRTAIPLQPSQCAVKIEHFHEEQMGNVPKMADTRPEYLRQSFLQLMNAYNQQKPVQTQSAVKAKLNELIHAHDIDFVIPISTLKLVLNNSKTSNWRCCMTVQDSVKSTLFHTKQKIIFEKPLPPTHLNGNERYRNGAKYLLYSCSIQNSSYYFNCNDQTETKIDIEPAIPPELESRVNESTEYKISSTDEFIRKYPKREYCYGNRAFTILKLSGRDDTESDDDETFKILIPAKLTAYQKTDANDQIQFVNFSPKIEFQAEYGAEVMTKDELLQEWCNLFFRPKTCTERGLLLLF